MKKAIFCLLSLAALSFTNLAAANSVLSKPMLHDNSYFHLTANEEAASSSDQDENQATTDSSDEESATSNDQNDDQDSQSQQSDEQDDSHNDDHSSDDSNNDY